MRGKALPKGKGRPLSRVISDEEYTKNLKYLERELKRLKKTNTQMFESVGYAVRFDERFTD